MNEIDPRLRIGNEPSSGPERIDREAPSGAGALPGRSFAELLEVIERLRITGEPLPHAEGDTAQAAGSDTAQAAGSDTGQGAGVASVHELRAAVSNAEHAQQAARELSRLLERSFRDALRGP